jgi:gamma-glutamylcyclotransferase (GGCT)/AIG2-like uncharacterized protein YtfP
VCCKHSEILSPGGACKEMIVPLPHKVFVYGSLLSNLKNHHVLTDLNHHARLVSENCRTVGMFYLTGLKSNEYPYLSEVPLHESQVSHRISGELYEVSSQALDTLDVFEEHPIEYLRSQIEVENLSPRYEDVNGAKLIVNVYLLKNELRIAEAKSVFESKFVIVNDGDWKSHLNRV